MINRFQLEVVFTFQIIGTLGIVTKSTGDPGAVVRNGQAYKELEAVEGRACRFFLLGVVPWGDATLSTAVDDALAKVNGQALINVTVSNSLYGFVPIYNVFATKADKYFNLQPLFGHKC